MLDLSTWTALVTGASSGIGRELVRVLAREVRGLILVARRKQRLDELATELIREHPTLEVATRALDVCDRAAVEEMFFELEREGRNIDLLVNNAGVGNYGRFAVSDWNKLEAMLELNVVSATHVVHRALPQMIARGFGAVLNVGSIAGIVPVPRMAAYAASKAYLNHFSEALRVELSDSGIVVTVLCPGPVETEFQEVAGRKDLRPPIPKGFEVDARFCAQQAVRALKRGRARVIPGGLVRSAMIPVESVPKVLVRPVLKRMLAR